MATKQRNRWLDELISESGCSHAGLARRVNQLGGEQGLDLRYDKTSVARWINGQQPRGVVPSLLAEALSRKLHRPVTVEDLGMRDSSPLSPDLGLEFARSTPESVEIVTEVWRSDVNRREFLLNSTFASAALAAPSRDWLIAPVDEDVDRAGGPRVGLSDVEAVRATGEMFRRLDNKFGGGHARLAVVQYLNSDVAALLKGSYTDKVGRQLFGAVAELTRLAGWMAYDIGEHGLAQRYFIQALRLAQSSGDRVLGGYVLATMSRQATYLGHGREAVQLARAAQQGAKAVSTPAAMAVFYSVEARGHGLVGDARSCSRALTAAESSLERTGDQEEPAWTSFFDEAQLADEFGHCYRDLGEPAQAQRFAERSLELRSDSYARSKAFCQTVLATAFLQQDDLEQACAVGGQALEQVSRLRSVRGNEYILEFGRKLAPYQSEPLVREFNARARQLVGSRRQAV
jgi:tetratricopeptide (TPR) repeat protein